jgi:hypothetical protein
LESAVEKLGILASITTDFQNDELSSMLGEEISRIIQEQRTVSYIFFLRTVKPYYWAWVFRRIDDLNTHAAATCWTTADLIVPAIISSFLRAQLEKRYEELIYQRRNMKGFSNRLKFQANEEVKGGAHKFTGDGGVEGGDSLK